MQSLCFKGTFFGQIPEFTDFRKFDESKYGFRKSVCKVSPLQLAPDKNWEKMAGCLRAAVWLKRKRLALEGV